MFQKFNLQTSSLRSSSFETLRFEFQVSNIETLEGQVSEVHILDIKLPKGHVSNIHVSNIQILDIHISDIQVHVLIFQEMDVFHVSEDLITNANETP